MSKTQKFYVVWQGNNPGIYNSWAECLSQVKAFPNAKYKAFSSKAEAEDAYYASYDDSIKRKQKSKFDWKNSVPIGSIAVDAACSGNPGDLEYRGVDPFSGKQLFHVGPLSYGTNNVGEFLALVHALALLQKNHKPKTAIYSDSKIAMNWIKLKKPNSKLQFTAQNKPLQALMERAILWLNKNSFENPIIKWDTENWGEIPADFGRK
ncbi:MAG: ribonuclease H family protein [Saprospiraceae bacterium]|nr:ribonuclease H family protein [Saprospiraceae bacterium]